MDYTIIFNRISNKSNLSFIEKAIVQLWLKLNTKMGVKYQHHQKLLKISLSGGGAVKSMQGAPRQCAQRQSALRQSKLKTM